MTCVISLSYRRVGNFNDYLRFQPARTVIF
ncbi:hypothetical protein CAEBREN_00616 [Caenorhabditis brenneri]|uniref:Uncharacterized protein n=1 Tax=Caenorhabditis brenneri TaxID=135651 RepID=G0P940_CAEBE|nr:hypothetical protein CAEBREN_00616 [Caenorhabditis brenneri]